MPAALARLRAVSGGARWDAGPAITETCQVSVGGLSGTSESVEDTRTGRSRTTLQLGGMAMASGFDGAPWDQAVGGEVVTLDAPDAVALATTMKWMTARGYLRAGRARYRELGAKLRGDRRFHAIEATPQGGAPIELWLDDATGLLAQTVHRDGANTVTTTFDDHRTVEGLALPHLTVEDPGDPRNRATFRVTAVQVRPSVDEAALARPRTDAERLSFTGGAHTTRLPFDLVNNHIYIRAQVDGQPVRMVVDTGGLNLLTPAAAARLGLASAGKLAGGGVGERKVDVGFARGRELAVGAVRLAAPVFYVLDLEALSDIEGEPFDGLVGFELFQRLAVRIDYPRRELTLTRREDFTPPAGAIAVPIDLRDRTPIARGSIDGIAARFVIDTGARNSVAASGPFTRANGLVARYRPAFETITGWGVGGPSRTWPVRLREVKLGDAVIRDVAGELFTGDKGAFADPDASANLGGGVLKRFVVTFDYRDRKMYLEPAPGVPRDVYDRAGMFFLADRPGAGHGAGGALRVAAVVPGGPSAHAGIAVDDRIVAIDGKPVASWPVWRWRELLCAGAIGARHRLTVERAGGRRDLVLVLAELLP